MPNKLPQAVISGVGPDKPGIVAALTQCLLIHGANIQDSTMTRLAHEFALIMIVTLPDVATLDKLAASLSKVETEMGMSFTVKALNEHPEYAVSGNPCMISVGGQDRTGITQAITQELANLNINITDLNAQVIAGQGGPAYIMMIEALVPTSLTLPEVEKSLKSADGCQALDIKVNPLDSLAF